MFHQINTMVRASGALTFKVFPGTDGKLKICVSPSGDTTKEAALLQPLILVATPEELNAEFASCLKNFQTARLSLEEQVAATTTILDAAKKTQSTKAVKSLSSKPAVPAGKDNDDDDNDNDDNDDNDDDTPVISTPSPKVIAPVDAGTDLSSLI